jgi:signal transduction histidine kinase
MLLMQSRDSDSFFSGRRDVEQQGRTAHELETILRMRAELLSIICHESRSLLATILGYTKRTLDGRSGSISDVQREHLEVVLRSANRLLDLVSYSGPFAIEQELRVELIDPREIWRNALQRQQPRLSERSLRVNEAVSGEPLVIEGDPAKLFAVFDIIAGWAIQSAASGGELRIQWSGSEFNYLAFSVTAPGPDLPQELADSIFDRHTEPPSDPLRNEKRRAAGLSLARDIVWLHGGRIALTRRPEGGSVIFVVLPRPRHPLELGPE